MNAASTAVFAGITGCLFVQPILASNTVTFKEKALYSFCSQKNCADGANPTASLIDVSGTFYGTTQAGGTTGCGGAGCGTVFSLDPNTGEEKVLYAFCSQANCADGASPYDNLIDVNGILYGTTYEGGVENPGCAKFGCGTVFSLDPNTGKEKVLYSFCSQKYCTDGASPWTGGLLNVKGMLYGTTTGGGNYGYGAVFALDPNSDAETVVYSFCGQSSCPDGAQPFAGLIEVKGVLYGTTPLGGGSGEGTAFALDPKNGTETVLYSFGLEQYGLFPYAALLDIKGTLYGTTYAGGSTGCGGEGCGTVFSIDPTSGAEKVLYAFLGDADGTYPEAGLIDMNGTLYGTTGAGGGTGCVNGFGCGTVFSVDPSTGTETVLYSFCIHKNCEDGANPTAGLIVENGNLYGTTEYGGGTGCGGGGCGTIFVVKRKR